MGFKIFISSGTFDPTSYDFKTGDVSHIICVDDSNSVRECVAIYW